MKKNHIVFLGIGANVGDKRKNIDRAVELLSKKIVDLQTAPIYETKPWGYTEQGNFLNSVAKGFTSLSPPELFVFAKNIEKKIGRIQRFKWGPREIDIDILFYDDLVIDEKDLQIPHPRLHERDFVLKPFIDLSPDFVHPVLKRTILQLYEEVPEKERVILRILRSG